MLKAEALIEAPGFIKRVNHERPRTNRLRRQSGTMIRIKKQLLSEPFSLVVDAYTQHPKQNRWNLLGRIAGKPAEIDPLSIEWAESV